MVAVQRYRNPFVFVNVPNAEARKDGEEHEQYVDHARVMVGLGVDFFPEPLVVLGVGCEEDALEL